MLDGSIGQTFLVRMEDVALWDMDVVELSKGLKEVLMRLVDRVADRIVLKKDDADGLNRVEHNGRQVLWISDVD